MAVSKPSTPVRAGGLRERKKTETRRRVAGIAERMFIERGYENVRMIDIARAADVSEQTLYNYFPTKEHLIFDRDREFQEFVLNAVIRRPRTQTLAESLRANALAFLGQIGPPIGKRSWVPASVASSPELRRAWLEITSRASDALTDALVGVDNGLPRPTAKLVARAIVALFATILEGVGESGLARKSRRTIVRELRAAIDASARILEHGIPDTL